MPSQLFGVVSSDVCGVGLSALPCPADGGFWGTREGDGMQRCYVGTGTGVTEEQGVVQVSVFGNKEQCCLVEKDIKGFVMREGQ